MRYLRLTELTPELLQLVDSGKLKFHPAVELSYLKPLEQELLHSVITQTNKYPSLTQAKTLKQLSKNATLEEGAILQFLRGEKTHSNKITFTADELRGYFPANYSTEQIKNAIFDVLEARQRTRAGRER